MTSLGVRFIKSAAKDLEPEELGGSRSFDFAHDDDWGPPPGRHPGGASSKPSKRKAGDTVQPTRVQAPRLRALCQTPSGTSSCGRSPAVSAVPRRRVSTVFPSGERERSRGAPL